MRLWFGTIVYAIATWQAVAYGADGQLLMIIPSMAVAMAIAWLAADGKS